MEKTTAILIISSFVPFDYTSTEELLYLLPSMLHKALDNNDTMFQQAIENSFHPSSVMMDDKGAGLLKMAYYQGVYDTFNVMINRYGLLPGLKDRLRTHYISEVELTKNNDIILVLVPKYGHENSTDRSPYNY